MKNSRRNFIIRSAVAGTALLGARLVAAATPAPLVQETDPQAVGLGYKADASKVDKAKFPKHAPGQMCATCALYQGKPADAAGPCPLFHGKRVVAKGWCSAWSKKA